MRGTAIGFVAALIVGGWMLGDLLAHPAGTQAAGNVVTTLWKTSAQGVAGQKIS